LLFTETLRYIGGSGLVNFMRGESTSNCGSHGDILVNPSKWGLFLPAPSTLQQYSAPVKIYSILNKTNILEIIQGLPSSCIDGGICFDEIELRHGLTYYRGEIVGLKEGPITKENFDNYLTQSEGLFNFFSTKKNFFFQTDQQDFCFEFFFVQIQKFNKTDQLDFFSFFLFLFLCFNFSTVFLMILFSMVLGEINGKLATKALQFFFVSTDGKCSLPLGFIPTTGITGQEIVGEVLNLISIFQEQEIEIHWTSSDGFQANRDFLEKIKSVYPNFLHFFDYEHLLKNLRNALINTRIQWPGHDNPFSMRDLYDFSVTHPQFRNYFKHDVFPVDKMIIKPVIDLLNVDFIDFLKNSESTQEIKGLVSYFEFMKEFYEVFRVNENWERKEKRITELLKIIQKLDNSGLSCHLIFELNLTLKKFTNSQKKLP